MTFKHVSTLLVLLILCRYSPLLSQELSDSCVLYKTYATPLKGKNQKNYLDHLKEAFCAYNISDHVFKYEKNEHILRNSSLSLVDSIYFKNFTPYPIDSFLIGNSDERVVIFNESHFFSFHRVFVSSKLKLLKSLGYKLLFLEGLKNNAYCDSLINSSSHFPIGDCGVYLNDPRYGLLIREAKALGFKIFAYESTRREASRELEQAKNIASVLMKHKNAKAIVYCGLGHLIENEGHQSFNFGKSKWLAYHLKHKYNINPVTFEQTILSPNKYSENPYYELIKSDNSCILFSKYKESFSPNVYFYADYFIYHPPTTLEKFRLSCLEYKKDLELVDVRLDNIKNIKYPITVCAQLKSEFPDGIPVDLVQIENVNQNTKTVILISYKNKEMRYTVFDRNGNCAILQ